MLDSGYLNLLGRVLLGLIFLISGINKIADPQGTQQYMTLMGMTTMTTLFYIGAVAMEIAGSLSLLLGYRTKAGAWLLFVFMIMRVTEIRFECIPISSPWFVILLKLQTDPGKRANQLV